MRAAIYVRVSTAAQVDGTSIATQLERCRAYVESRGWTIAGEFRDEGESGAKASRPQLDAMLATVRAGKVDAVVTWKLDRLGRSVRHLSNLLGDLDDAKVTYVSVSDNLDYSTAAGRAMRSIQATFAELERETIAERTMAGIRATARHGGWPGGPPPFGFRLIGAKPTRLTLDDGEAEVLRAATSLVVDDGMSVYAAAQALNGLGLRPRVGERWTHQNLRRALKDETLGGRWTYRSAVEPISLAVPAILPPDRHAALLGALGAAALSPKNPDNTRFYLLSRGRLTGECGAPYHGIWRRDRESRAYRCGNRRPDAVDRCADQPINADIVEEIVWAEIVTLLSDPDALMARAEQALGLDADDPDARESEIGKAEREINALTRARKDGVVQAMKAGLDAATMKAATDVIDEEIVQVSARLERLVALRDRVQAGSARAERLRAFAAHARERLATATPVERRQLVDLLDVRVMIEGWETCSTCDGRGKVRLPCTEPGCDEPHYSRGYCRSHYWRVRRSLEPQGSPPSGGESCPTCRAMRRVPRLRLTGVVAEGLALRGVPHEPSDFGGLPFAAVA